MYKVQNIMIKYSIKLPNHVLAQLKKKLEQFQL